MFLQEEQQLLHAIASQVGSCVSKFTREQLVHSMLPPKVALELQLHQKVAPQTYETVSILFTDIVGFTVISSKCSPDEICNMLDRLYKRFDEVVISSQKLLYKIETIGDAYMVVSGLPQRNLPPAATALTAVVCGLAFIEAAKGIYAVGKDGEKIDVCIRAGVHSGMVVAGVVGKLMPRYCLFGDTVNTASRMESNGVKIRSISVKRQAIWRSQSLVRYKVAKQLILSFNTLWTPLSSIAHFKPIKSCKTYLLHPGARSL